MRLTLWPVQLELIYVTFNFALPTSEFFMIAPNMESIKSSFSNITPIITRLVKVQKGAERKQNEGKKKIIYGTHPFRSLTISETT